MGTPDGRAVGTAHGYTAAAVRGPLVGDISSCGLTAWERGERCSTWCAPPLPRRHELARQEVMRLAKQAGPSTVPHKHLSVREWQTQKHNDLRWAPPGYPVPGILINRLSQS